MNNIRILLWAVVVLAGSYAAYLVLNKVTTGSDMKLGAPFSLQATNGKTLTEKDMLGRPHLVFFGFTHCPEVCPTTLYEITGWMEKLGSDGDRLDAYFVSIDPERDTVDLLKSYISPFDDNILGLTGPLDEVDKLAKGYHVYYQKVPTESNDYTMDHTATIYMMKADGSFMGTIAWQENTDVALEKIRRLLNS